MKSFVAFVLGLGAGIAGTWFYLNKKYEERLAEETDSIIKAFRNDDEPEEETSEDDKKTNKMVEDSSIDNVKEFSRQIKAYKNYSAPDSIEAESIDPMDYENEEEPKIITYDEFGEFDDYDKVSLTFYAYDKILCDENDEPLKNPRQYVGDDWKDEFENGESVVLVRNFTYKIDYEITRADFSYIDDVVCHKPKRGDDE